MATPEQSQGMFPTMLSLGILALFCGNINLKIFTKISAPLQRLDYRPHTPRERYRSCRRVYTMGKDRAATTGSHYCRLFHTGAMALFLFMMTIRCPCVGKIFDSWLCTHKVHGVLLFIISYLVLCRWFDKEDTALNLAHFHKHKKHQGAQRQRLASTSGSKEPGSRPPGIHHQWGLQVRGHW